MKVSEALDLSERPSGARLSGAVALALVLAACGAKTGLDVPDANLDVGTEPDSGQSPSNVDAGPPEDIPCAEVPFEGALVEVPLELDAELARADVLFLVDRTRSMEGEIQQIQEGLRDDIAPGIRDAIPDSQLSVATLGDFRERNCGEDIDTPFQMLLTSTSDLSQVQAAVDSIRLGNGLDQAESQVEALFQVATGAGIEPYVEPSFGCPAGGVGYPCFRTDALPVILLFTDAPFHNGPDGDNPYATACRRVLDVASRPPATYAQAVDALEAIGARVIGLSSSEPGEAADHLERIVRDTGGDPDELFFDIGGQGQRLSTSVVEAIRILADIIEFDVDTVLLDANPRDEVDPTEFVERVLAVRAEPMNRVQRIDRDSGTFFGVRAGTRVFVELELFNDAVAPGPEPQSFFLEVLFRGDRRTRLGSRLVRIVVPGADGQGCDIE